MFLFWWFVVVFFLDVMQEWVFVMNDMAMSGVPLFGSRAVYGRAACCCVGWYSA
jgi:hypothetical protein